MNAILKDIKQMEFHTNLNPIFMSIKNRQLNYNWLLTDLELNWMPDGFVDYCHQHQVHAGIEDRSNSYLISGENLTKLTMEYDIQFIWGVLTGLKKEVNIDINSIVHGPYADHSELWKPSASVQYPGAELEIVCWDSTLTLLISQDCSMVNDFKSYFSGAKDLDEYISEVANI